MAFFGRTCKFVFSRAKIADDPFLVMSSLERTFALKYWGNVYKHGPSLTSNFGDTVPCSSP